MYLCAFRSGGAPLDRRELLTHGAGLRGETDVSAVLAGPFGAAVPARRARPVLARWKHLVAVGDVRLDNRAELARLAGLENTGTDLELVMRVVDVCGEKCIPSILGDFAFVLWDPRAHKLLVARDAFGVRPLYYRRTAELVLFSDRMDAIAAEGCYDLDYIGDFLTGLVSPGDRTIWSAVRSVPAAGFMMQRGTVRSSSRYWSADAFPAEAGGDEAHHTDQFLSLAREAVRSRIGAAGATWSQLSGGLDSSSIVALAQNVAGPGQGLAGTITLVDTLGSGDERRYADSVVRRYDVRNEQVRDYWAWQEDGAPPPNTDGPRPLYPFYARERRTLELVHGAGGRVVLSGFGSDHYLTGNFNYITDLVAHGEVRAALRDLVSWSVATRQSFWGLTRRHVVSPLLASLRHGRHAQPNLPAWIDRAFARSAQLAERTVDAHESTGTPGRMFGQKLSRDLASIPAWVDRWPYGEEVETRYPFLHRPLVEAGLRLPPRLRIRPEGTKWILRQSMRGMLPEEVRTRPTKGTIDARIVWSLQRERHRIDSLLRDPILARLGCINADALRREVDAVRRGLPGNLVMLMSVLSLETWLCVRAGEWTALTDSRRSAA